MVTFDSEGVELRRLALRRQGDAFAPAARTTGRGDGARPGRHQGLRACEPFAEQLAAAGLDVLAFDYRGFGASDGTPRQTISASSRQVEDYRAAMAAAAEAARRRPEPARAVGMRRCPGGHVLAGGRATRRRRRGDRHDTDGRARWRPAGWRSRSTARVDGAPLDRRTGCAAGSRRRHAAAGR